MAHSMSYWYAKDGAPKRCTRCDSTKLCDEIRSRDEAYIYEYSVDCGDCGKPLGYFAYGSWDPQYEQEAFEIAWRIK